MFLFYQSSLLDQSHLHFIHSPIHFHPSFTHLPKIDQLQACLEANLLLDHQKHTQLLLVKVNYYFTLQVYLLNLSSMDFKSTVFQDLTFKELVVFVNLFSWNLVSFIVIMPFRKGHYFHLLLINFTSAHSSLLATRFIIVHFIPYHSGFFAHVILLHFFILRLDQHRHHLHLFLDFHSHFGRHLRQLMTLLLLYQNFIVLNFSLKNCVLAWLRDPFLKFNSLFQVHFQIIQSLWNFQLHSYHLFNPDLSHFHFLVIFHSFILLLLQ